MPTTSLMLPPQSETTREWARRLAEATPELDIIAPETMEGAEQAIGHADGAFGRIPPALLARADKLRWLQAPQAAPPAGFYYQELIEHPVVITNFREIYNDHIGAHVMAFVLAFARGLQVYLPQQLRRPCRPAGRESGDVVHLPDASSPARRSTSSNRSRSRPTIRCGRCPECSSRRTPPATAPISTSAGSQC